MKKSKLLSICFLFSAAVLFLLSCKDDSDSKPEIKAPVISSFSPVSGKYDDVITIKGKNFGKLAGEIDVRLAGKPVVVNSVNDSVVVVKLTKGSHPGQFSILRKGNPTEAKSDIEFKYNYTVSVTTFAGQGVNGGGRGNYTDADNGTGVSAKFCEPRALAIDANDNIYVGEFRGKQSDDNRVIRVRKITPAGAVSTLATIPSTQWCEGIAVDKTGNLYVSVEQDHMIYKVSTSGGTPALFAGTKGKEGKTDGARASALFNNPQGLACDNDGNLYVADQGNRSIRKISTTGDVTTLSGTMSAPSFTANGAPLYLGANFGLADTIRPTDIMFDQNGVMFISAWAANTWGAGASSHIFKMPKNGAMSIFAGSKAGSFPDWSFNNVPRTVEGHKLNTATLWAPYGLASDSTGNIFVVDEYQKNIRIIAGDEMKVLSGSWFANAPSDVSDGPATSAKFNNPRGIVVNSKGEVFVADTNNDRIRKILLE